MANGPTGRIKERFQKTEKFIEQIEDELYRKVVLKYTIMRVRYKISYEAFIRDMTISELFGHTILYSLGMITCTFSQHD